MPASLIWPAIGPDAIKIERNLGVSNMDDNSLWLPSLLNGPWFHIGVELRTKVKELIKALSKMVTDALTLFTY